MRTIPAWRSCETRPSTVTSSRERARTGPPRSKLARPVRRSSRRQSSVRSNGTSRTPARRPVATSLAPPPRCESVSRSSRAKSESPRASSSPASRTSGRWRAGTSSASATCAAAARTRGEAGPDFASSGAVKPSGRSAADSRTLTSSSSSRAMRGRRLVSRGASATVTRPARSTGSGGTRRSSSSPRTSTPSGQRNESASQRASSPRAAAAARSRAVTTGATIHGRTSTRSSTAAPAMSQARRVRSGRGGRGMPRAH